MILKNVFNFFNDKKKLSVKNIGSISSNDFQTDFKSPLQMKK